MVQTQVQLTEEQAQALRQLAAARQSTVAELVRQSIDRLILQSVSADDREKRQRAILAAGRFHSGRSNISVEHDQHLAEAHPA